MLKICDFVIRIKIDVLQTKKPCLISIFIFKSISKCMYFYFRIFVQTDAQEKLQHLSHQSLDTKLQLSEQTNRSDLSTEECYYNNNNNYYY